MKITPYLSFNGDCATAFKFYEKTLGGKIGFMMTYAESPMAEQFPSESKKIMHAALTIGDQVISGADSCGGEYEKPQGLRITINVDTPAEADRIFKALAEDGTVQMECQETFWAQRFGMVDDHFGTPWMINCEKKR
jgi:PhnB protein